MSVVPFIEGKRVLEIGHGPGHLQRILLSRGLVAVGIDESAQMGRLAKRNLKKHTSKSPSLVHPNPRSGYTQINLTRGLAQSLPFPGGSFETVIATFPSEYITDPRTLAEVKRCLSSGGRFVVLPVAWPRSRILDWLFRVTGEAPSEALELVTARFNEPFIRAGFETEIQTLDVKSGVLLIILAKKP